jgi:hypothetical protein
VSRGFGCFKPVFVPVVLVMAACTMAAPTQQTTLTEAAALELVAIGDMPYRPIDIAPFEALLERISDNPPDVTIHVGDIKSSGTPCTDAVLIGQRDYLNSVAGAVVFTPGDNEWTDCHTRPAGGYDPRERLAFLRDLFFVADRSLGQQPRVLEQQSAQGGDFAPFVENARWQQNGVRLVTAHVVGSNNGLDRRDPAAVAEYDARNMASTTWIREGFALARAEGAYALVLAMQADPFLLYGIGGGFLDTLDAISEGAAAFGKPVLVVHGDGHEYTVDTPFYGSNGQLLENVIRLEVPGAADIRAVRVRIDPNAAKMFAFEPFGPG